MSVFTPIPAFTFSNPPGNALHKSKPAQNCEPCRKRKTKQQIKETTDRPTGYTHVSDTSILANRVAQLELVLSRLITRVDSVDSYRDLIHEFKDPLPVFRPNAKERDNMDKTQQGSKRDNSERPRYETSVAPSQSMDGRDMGDNTVESRTDEQHLIGESSSLDFGRSTSIIRTAWDTGADVEPSGPSTHLSEGTLGIDRQTPAGAGLIYRSMDGLAILSDSVTSVPPGIDQMRSVPVSLNDSLTPYLHSEKDWLGMLPHGPLSSKDNALDGMEPITQSSLDLLNNRDPLTEPGSKMPSTHEHDASLALEGMAFGREYSQNDEPRSGGTPMQPGVESDASPGYVPTFSSFINLKKTAHLTPARRTFTAVSELPSLIIGKYVLAHYLDHVNYMWPCLHRPSFEQQYRDLCVQIRTNTKEFTIDQLSTLALYAACLAVGFHFLEEESYQDLNIDEAQAVELGATCWEVAYKALEASDWMQVNDIRSCQTIIVSGLYLSGIRRANQHWNLLGVATKIAMALGLAQIPDERLIVAAGSVERIPPRWRSSIHREIGRRVWFCLLELDWLFSMEHDYLYIISPEVHQTLEPANIDDADIKDDEPIISRPLDTHTVMSYFLQRLRLLYPLQGVVTAVKAAGRMRYHFVTQAHDELQRAIAERPQFYRHPDTIDAPMDAIQLNQIKREAASLYEATDLRTMRIHRFYFPASCENSTYLLTKQTCLAIARRTLTSVGSRVQSTSQVHPHFWALGYFIFTVTVVIIIYLHHALPQELEEYQALAERGIQWLKASAQKGSIDLGDSGDTLQTLMQIQLNRRDDSRKVGEQSHKRSLSEFAAGEGWSNFVTPGFNLAGDSSVPDYGVDGGPVLTDEQNMSFMLDSLFRDMTSVDPSFLSS
nr:uncharacterized protein CI109_004172 [Kwoniella shandongensis]KAA5527360.1 hypothetical protein CI109_004172 [Kwoniella shandongensis]